MSLERWLESDYDRYCRDDRFGIPANASRAKIDWLILRGETGPDARPCPLHVLRRLIGEAQAAGVPVWVEGLGSRPESDEPTDGRNSQPLELGMMPWQINFRDPDGSDPAEWPEWARVRELPNTN